MKFEFVYNIFPTLARFQTEYNPGPHDAAMLGELGVRASKIKARNHKTYWYFFPKNPKFVDLARLLLRRNGIYPMKHMSRYMPVEKTLVLRVPYSQLTQRGTVAFTKSVENDIWSQDKSTREAVLAELKKLNTAQR